MTKKQLRKKAIKYQNSCAGRGAHIPSMAEVQAMILRKVEEEKNDN